MRITLLAVGKLKTPEWRQLAAFYTRRIGHHIRFEVVEVRDADVTREGERLAASLDKLPDGPRYLLAEEGADMTSRELAGKLAEVEGGHLAFVLGGPYGLSKPLKERGQLLSLSPMTFPHEMARVVLLEQLYRALSINAGSNYHHD